MKTLKLVICAILLQSYLPSFSQPTIVKDVNTTPGSIIEDYVYDDSFFCKCGNYLYFVANTEFGKELWKTDGTASATALVKDVNPGLKNGAYGGVCINNLLYFSGTNDQYGTEPWVSDGTTEGTRLLIDIVPGPNSSNVSYPLVIGESSYFLRSSSQGTTLSRYSPSSPQALSEIITIPETQVYSTIKADHYYYFVLGYYPSGTNNTIWQLWRTDGSATGTVKLHEGTDYLGALTSVNDQMFFSYYNYSTYGSALWVADGATDEARLVKEVPWIGSYYKSNDKLIFGATNSTWASDGTEEGTEQISLITLFKATPYNGSLYATGFNPENHRNVLFHTDGTSSGTQTDVIIDDSEEEYLQSFQFVSPLNGKFVVTITSAENGIELGITDGTQANTHLLKDVFPGSTNSSSRSFTTFNDKVFFIANDGEHGSEIWVTDGTETGTQLFKDLSKGTQDGWIWSDFFYTLNDQVNYTSEPLTANNKVGLFSIDDHQDVNNYYTFDALLPNPIGLFKEEFYFFDAITGRINKTNGTAGGTVLLKDFSPDYGYTYVPPIANGKGAGVTVGNKFIFPIISSGESGVGFELGVTDGTAEGTQVLKDINPGVNDGISFSSWLAMNDHFFFSGSDGQSGLELWSTNGTSEGTNQVIDINPGGSSSNPGGITQLGNQMLFSADDGVHGPELWTTDGTASGTKLIKDINPSASGLAPQQFVKLNDKIIFSAYDTETGWRLWKSDGTEEGTTVIKDIIPGHGTDQFLNVFAASNGLVYLTANDETHGSELWVTDGTEAGTKLIDVVPGATGSNPALFTSTETWTYFSANNQLWRTDGSALNTYKVTDMTPIYIIYHEGWIYFSAKSADYGAEVFKIEVAKQDQSISFSTIPVKVLGNDPFIAEASTSAGLLVSLSTSSDKISMSDSTVTILLKPGSVTINADQSGNDFFNAAPRVSQIFCISPSKPTIITSNDPSGYVLLTSSNADGNEWFIDGSLIAEANSNTYLAKETGNYSLQVSVEECESEISEMKSVNITGLTNNSNELSVYPNPVTNSLSINYGTDQPAVIEILTSKGVSLQQFSSTSAANIDVSSYTNGMYIIKISTVRGVVIKKFVKN